jgi:MerR family copper efflux transcriptional regulator
MSKEGFNIAQAAAELGVSARTIRRYIKSGKLSAELVIGHFGEEYRILEIPPELYSSPASAKASTTDQTPGQGPGQNLIQAVDIIRELQEKNLALAAQLGVATERIRHLEGRIKLLDAPKKPWWRRIFSRQAEQQG